MAQHEILQTSIRLPTELVEKLIEAAILRGLNQTQAIIHALRFWVDEPEKDPARRLEAAFRHAFPDFERPMTASELREAAAAWCSQESDAAKFHAMAAFMDKLRHGTTEDPTT